LHERWASVELKALSQLPDVSVFIRRQSEGKLEEQGEKLLQQCHDHAARAGADWVFEADVDEVLLTGPFVLLPEERLSKGDVPTSPAPAAQCRSSDSARALGVARALQAVPASVVQVVLPRYEFVHGNVAAPPPGWLQCEAYTWRDTKSDEWKNNQSAGFVYAPKMLIRVSHLASPVKTWGMHTTGDSRPAIRSIDGMAIARNRTSQQLVWELMPPSHAHPSMRVTADFTAHSLRMYHYITRSTAECKRKMADTVRAVSTGAIPSSWRAGQTSMCEQHRAFWRNFSLRRDASAACMGPLVRERVEMLRDQAWGNAL